MSFRNRMVLVGAEGKINLSIPLKNGRNQNVPIRDVRICYSDRWQLAHWRTITSCYNRSPWFEFFRYELESLFQKQYEFLFDWNLECLKWIFRKLELKVSIGFTDSFFPVYDNSQILDFRNRITPKTITEFIPTLPRYSQVFEDRLGFIAGLSSLDLLFCKGKWDDGLAGKDRDWV